MDYNRISFWVIYHTFLLLWVYPSHFYQIFNLFNDIITGMPALSARPRSCTCYKAIWYVYKAAFGHSVPTFGIWFPNVGIVESRYFHPKGLLLDLLNSFHFFRPALSVQVPAPPIMQTFIRLFFFIRALSRFPGRRAANLLLLGFPKVGLPPYSFRSILPFFISLKRP